MQQSLHDLWSCTGELFDVDEVDAACQNAGMLPDLAAIRSAWDLRVNACLAQATLARPEDGWMKKGGKQGVHSEHLSYMLAEMQVLPRTYPNATW